MGENNDPQSVFLVFDDDSLVILGEKIGVAIPKSKKFKEIKDKVVEELVIEVNREGVNRVFAVLKVDSLKMMFDSLPNNENVQQRWQELSPRRPVREKSPSRKKKDEDEDEPKKKKGKQKEREETPIVIYLKPKKEELKGKKFPPKGVMLKILTEEALKVEVREFLNQFDDMTLLSICNDIDDLREYSEDELRGLAKKELVKAILNNITNFGITHVLQFLTVDELKDIAEHMDLEVESGSKEKLIDSIVEKKNYKKPPKKKKQKTK